MIPLSVPNIKGNEKKYVNECIETEWVSSVGTYVDLFEENIKDFTKAKFSVATSSGTTALELALKCVGVRPEDEVIVPTMTFIATPNSVTYNGAHPIFFDCDQYLNLDISKFKNFIENNTFFKNGFTFNKNSKRRISAIVPVHVSGNALQIQELVRISKERNIKVVEDAAEALGTKYIESEQNERHAGTLGDIGCLSFNGNKIITTGGGGMIITNNEDYAKKAKYLSTQANNDSMNYVHNEVGYNYRLTNVQAAIGVGQLERINEFVDKKKYINDFYKDFFSNSPFFSILESPKETKNNHWMSSLVINEISESLNLENLIKYLTKNQIQVRPMWHLCHLQLPYLKNETYQIDNSLDLRKRVLNIPCSTNIKDEELEKVCEVISNFSK